MVKIRGAASGDIPRIVEIELACPEAAHWTELHYHEAMAPYGRAPERLFLLAEGPASRPESGAQKTIIVAFLVARHVAPEWELENIVVEPNARRKGVGTQLLNALLDHASKTNSTSVFLEVRESNASARAIYERAGFLQSGKRKSYYSNPQEDAIVYTFSFV